MKSNSEDEPGWWEETTEEEGQPSPGPLLSTQISTDLSQSKPDSKTPSHKWGLTLGSVGLLIGLFSPWGFWYESGFEALRWFTQDINFVLTEGVANYDEWGFTPLSFIEWALFPMLSPIFVMTFVVTWYKFLQGDEEFGRKASTFHLSIFGIWYLLVIIEWGFFLPTGWDYGMFIAAASGIGLHPTAYGLTEKISIS